MPISTVFAKLIAKSIGDYEKSGKKPYEGRKEGDQDHDLFIILLTMLNNIIGEDTTYTDFEVLEFLCVSGIQTLVVNNNFAQSLHQFITEYNQKSPTPYKTLPKGLTIAAGKPTRELDWIRDLNHSVSLFKESHRLQIAVENKVAAGEQTPEIKWISDLRHAISLLQESHQLEVSVLKQQLAAEQEKNKTAQSKPTRETVWLKELNRAMSLSEDSHRLQMRVSEEQLAVEQEDKNKIIEECRLSNEKNQELEQQLKKNEAEHSRVMQALPLLEQLNYLVTVPQTSSSIPPKQDSSTTTSKLNIPPAPVSLTAPTHPIIKSEKHKTMADISTPSDNKHKADSTQIMTQTLGVTIPPAPPISPKILPDITTKNTKVVANKGNLMDELKQRFTKDGIAGLQPVKKPIEQLVETEKKSQKPSWTP